MSRCIAFRSLPRPGRLRSTVSERVLGGPLHAHMAAAVPLSNTKTQLKTIDMPSMLGQTCKGGTIGSLFEPGRLALGGHRGMGMNFDPDGGPLAFRENTCDSLLRAAASGASFVEFDVQVTADGVPVLWHDDMVHRKLADGCIASSPIAALTLPEFQRIYEQSRKGQPLLRRFFSRNGKLGTLREWRCQSDEQLPTLAEVLFRVPEHVGFDIEVKMAVPRTVERTPAAEVDRCVDPILKCVSHARTSQRRIMYSSFDPEVCSALRQRQSQSAVLFLLCGIDLHADPRRNTMTAAVEFALHNQLQGLVMETRTLRCQPVAAAAARERGLQLMTFGLDNNDPAWVALQHLQWGVSAAIVDDVAYVASYLQSFSVTSQPETAEGHHYLGLEPASLFQSRLKAVAV